MPKTRQELEQLLVRLDEQEEKLVRRLGRTVAALRGALKKAKRLVDQWTAIRMADQEEAKAAWERRRAARRARNERGPSDAEGT